MDTILLILSVPLFVLLTIDFIKHSLTKKGQKNFLLKQLGRAFFLVTIVLTSLIIVQQYGNNDSFLFGSYYYLDDWHYWSIGSATFLMLLWFFFLRKMDFFEKERIHHLIIVFVLSIGCMYLIYPLHYFIFEVMHIGLPRNAFGELFYFIVGVGFIEEFVKIIPVLLFLRFSKAINEPFDYILYASVSALGFAFIENIQYFDYGLEGIAFRGVFCCLGHMALSSIVAYGMMLAKYRHYNKFLLFGGFIIIASVLHGLYDFALITQYTKDLVFIADIVVIFLIILWVYFMNNTLNMSPFYQRDREFQPFKIQYLVLTICLTIIMTGYIAVGLERGKNSADSYLTERMFSMLFFILLLLFSIGRLTLVKGNLASFHLPFKKKNQALKQNDLSGSTILLMPSDNLMVDLECVSKNNLFQEATLLHRLIVSDKLNTYVIKLTNKLDVDDFINDKLLAVPVWDEKQLNSKKPMTIRLYLIKSVVEMEMQFAEIKHFKFIGIVFSQLQ